MATTPKAFLSRSEVARLFHVSPITVVRWADRGKLPYEVTLGGRRRYPTAGTLAILRAVTRGAEGVRRGPPERGNRPRGPRSSR
jgi:MerR-like DNA binding protein